MIAPAPIATEAAAFELLLAATCAATEVAAPEVRGLSRRAPLVRARHLTWYLCATVTGASHQRIADHFEVERSTISHAIRSVEWSLAFSRESLRPALVQALSHYVRANQSASSTAPTTP